ncbi:hypothetical protein [Mycolicibacterium sp. P9-64]|uniref:hypothetical protein n=1 Tax=Mycolicibacterium sp. P9-64 TaxID=2024612 RepID=UPI001F5BC8EA|nr:hypothetical protein [Mycolicibacterium sp. P9-64]
MKKLVVLGAGTFAVVGAALLSPAVAYSDPGTSSLNVVGEPYGRAVGILKSQGVKPSFGGSVGSDLPQAACIVDSQKVTSQGRMILMLNCTQKAADDATASQPAAQTAPGAAPGAPGAATPGQGTYGHTIGQPIPVG